MLDSMALISNSRALTKAATSSSPSLFTAWSAVCVKRTLAEDVLTRFASDCGGPDGGCFRFVLDPADILTDQATGYSMT